MTVITVRFWSFQEGPGTAKEQPAFFPKMTGDKGLTRYKSGALMGWVRSLPIHQQSDRQTAKYLGVVHIH